MTMPWEEWIGFLAFALNVVGNWMLTNKRIGGWPVRFACNAAQLAYAILIKSPSLALSAVVFGGINVVGYVRWSARPSKEVQS